MISSGPLLLLMLIDYVLCRWDWQFFKATIIQNMASSLQ